MDDETSIPLRGHVFALLVSAAGVVLAVVHPGTLAFWVSPPLLAVLPITLALAFLRPWGGISPRRRLLASVVAAALAVAGGLLVLLEPSQRSYVFGTLLVLPLTAILVRREEEDPRKRTKDHDPAFDLPDF